MPFLFSALAIRAVGRTAGVVVREVRDQFADGQIMAGTKQPDYAPVIDICTAASLRELTTPALLAVLTPVIVGFGIGWQALGGFLAAVILTGQLMANYLSNSGGAWDNAKKYIEDGHHGGKGSEAHKAAVIGDTVGDPFKDTAGPALNPLIKVMNLVSLLMLPAIINLEDRRQRARFAVAGVAAVVLIAAIVYSSRRTEGIAAASTPAAPAAEARSNRRLSPPMFVLALGPTSSTESWFDKATSAPPCSSPSAIIFADPGDLLPFAASSARRLAATLHRVPDSPRRRWDRRSVRAASLVRHRGDLVGYCRIGRLPSLRNRNWSGCSRPRTSPRPKASSRSTARSRSCWSALRADRAPFTPIDRRRDSPRCATGVRSPTTSSADRLWAVWNHYPGHSSAKCSRHPGGRRARHLIAIVVIALIVAGIAWFAWTTLRNRPTSSRSLMPLLSRIRDPTAHENAEQR